MRPGFNRDPAGFSTMTGIVLGKVVDVHPEHNSVDVRSLGDRRRLIGVPVVGIGNSGTSGLVDLPVPDLTTARDEDNKWKSGNTDKRDIMAVIAFIEGSPVCLGFVYPPITEMTFEGDAAKERRLFRHASDYYSLLDKRANVEISHPSGTWIGMSETPTKTRLTEKDYDRRWQVKRNLKRAVHGVISWWNGNEKERARAHLTPEGNLKLSLNERAKIVAGADGGESAAVDIGADGAIKIHGNDSVVISYGQGTTAGGKVQTPSFTPSESPGGEKFEYDGNPESLGSAQCRIEINADGVTITAPEININGSLYVNGVPVP